MDNTWNSFADFPPIFLDFVIICSLDHHLTPVSRKRALIGSACQFQKDNDMGFLRNGEKVMHLIAGYVRMVAILFETAPNTKAVNADSTTGDEPCSVLFGFPLRRFCFS